MKVLPKSLRIQLVVIDIFFILYWIATALHLFPTEYLYSDYTNPILVAWNWSYFSVDILFAALGLISVWLTRIGRDSAAKTLAIISLTLMHASGLMAISFWTIRSDFDLTWWAPNLYLAMMPLFYIRWSFRE